MAQLSINLAAEHRAIVDEIRSKLIKAGESSGHSTAIQIALLSYQKPQALSDLIKRNRDTDRRRKKK